MVLLNFWATWCEPCREEMPRLQSLASTFQGQPLTIDEIDFEEDAASVAPFVSQIDLHVPVLLDQPGDVARAYGVRGLPATFLIDTSGTIQQVRLGPIGTSDDGTTWTEPWLAQQIRSLLPA